MPLYLLDTNIPANAAEDRGITARLYGGDHDMRIRQEIVLGIGGSALGNIALQSALNPYTYNLMSERTRPGPQIFVLDNVEKNIPIGINENMYEAITTYQRRAPGGGRLRPGNPLGR